MMKLYEDDKAWLLNSSLQIELWKHFLYTVQELTFRQK